MDALPARIAKTHAVLAMLHLAWIAGAGAAGWGWAAAWWIIMASKLVQRGPFRVRTVLRLACGLMILRARWDWATFVTVVDAAVLPALSTPNARPPGKGE